MNDEEIEGLEEIMGGLRVSNVEHLEEKVRWLVEVAHIYEDKIEDMQGTMNLMLGRIEYLEYKLEVRE